MKKTSRHIESVETHNLYLSLRRLSVQGYSRRWKMALYHAMVMHAQLQHNELAQIRSILGLP